jgi:hypothetical protein
MKLIDPTDDQLNEAFAVHVAGWTHVVMNAGKQLVGRLPPSSLYSVVPLFTTSADAVLPWLERDAFDVRISFSNTCDTWHVELLGRFTSNRSFKAAAETFPRACVIALLRAHGVEIEFTKATP